MTDATILRRALRRADALQAMASDHADRGMIYMAARLFKQRDTAVEIARDARARIEAARKGVKNG
jgi:hypothetical protein